MMRKFNFLAITFALAFLLTACELTNTIPTADDQNVTTTEGTAVAIALTGSDADGDSLTFAVQSEPRHGELSGTAPDLTYTPDDGFSGSDAFTFTVDDGQESSAAATVSIEVSEGYNANVVKVYLMAGQSNMEGNNTSVSNLELLICHANDDYSLQGFACGSHGIDSADANRLFIDADDPLNDYYAAVIDYPNSPATETLGEFLCTAGKLNPEGSNCNTQDYDLTGRLFATISEYYYNDSNNAYAWGNDAFKQISAAMGVADIQADGLLTADLLAERSDVTVLQFTGKLSDLTLSFSERYGALSPRFGARTQNYGPELVFGHYMGELSAHDVLLVKVVQGGTDLRVDWKTPCSAANSSNNFTEDELAQESLYDALIDKANQILDPDQLAAYFPQYAGKQAQIAGFIWFQGWNDGGKSVNEANYETNLTCLINDLRSDLNLPSLPVVIAQSHYGDPDGPIQTAQANVAAAMDNTGLAITDDLSGYYHFDSAAHLVIGKRMADQMQLLMQP